MKRIVIYRKDLITLEGLGINKSFRRWAAIRKALGKLPGETVSVGDYARLMGVDETSVIACINPGH